MPAQGMVEFQWGDGTYYVDAARALEKGRIVLPCKVVVSWYTDTIPERANNFYAIRHEHYGLSVDAVADTMQAAVAQYADYESFAHTQQSLS
jgi:hypothetical protein